MSDLILGLAGVIQKEISSLSTVAQNAANANTVGYKSVQDFATLAGIEPGKPESAVMERRQSSQDVRQSDGALRYTGRSTDLALSGNAWFVVNTPQGVRLTRDGRFHLDADGVLVTAKGFPVMGEGGVLRLTGDVFSVERDGRIVQGGNELGRLVLVSASGAFSLKAEADGLYRPEAGLAAASGHAVHQGSLEQSNVNLSTDMVRLMETTRHIESVQRALSAYDSLMGTGVGQIGKE